MYQATWQDVYNKFRQDFPGLAEEATSWWPSGRCEITIVLEDRSRIVYDELERAFRYIPDVPRTEEQWRIEFADNLKRLMRRAGITSQELSDRVDVSTRMISKYLNHKATPSHYIIERISIVLGCSVNELTQPLELE